jgi:surfeit locus 1 family protein
VDHVPPQHQHDADDGGGGALRRIALLLLALLGAACFAALGVWQVERLAWKRDLIARVEARIHAAPAPIPVPSAWPTFNARAAEYRRVRLQGVFLHSRETLVQAVTERGAGFWVLTPLRTARGIVLVNRGFVPPDKRAPSARWCGPGAQPVSVTGLLRASEPGGGFLRANDPAAGRWYSRDVAAIARAQRLGTVAPFFVDADATPNPGGYPIGGLTVVRFSDNHLIYAITWFALAAMSVGGAVLLARRR